MKKLLFTALACFSASCAIAQPGWSKNWFDNIRLNGYVITEYQYSGQKDNESNQFSTRLVRLDFKGTVAKEIDFRIQAQLNGMPNSSSGPRIVDAYLEWTRFEFARIKVGQFKRAFTFDNPSTPSTTDSTAMHRQCRNSPASATVTDATPATDATSVFRCRATS